MVPLIEYLVKLFFQKKCYYIKGGSDCQYRLDSWASSPIRHCNHKSCLPSPVTLRRNIHQPWQELSGVLFLPNDICSIDSMIFFTTHLAIALTRQH